MNKYEIYNIDDGYLISIDDELTLYEFYDVPKQIVDIIKQLEQENNQLKEQLEGVQEEREYLFNKLSIENKYLQQENKELHNKIDKAIEYINTTVVMGDGTKLRNTIDGERLLEILKDSDVDE